MASNSFGTHSFGSTSTLPPKPPRPLAKETGEGSSGTGRVSGIKPGEAPLASYLMARAALHRNIDGPVLKNLRAGQETVQEVGDRFPLGRANVREDIQKLPAEHTSQRFMASCELKRRLIATQKYPIGTSMPQNHYFQMVAGIGQFAKTGLCGAYAASTTSLHAAKLAGKQDEHAIVAQANDSRIDHVWSEMIPKGKGTNGNPDVHGEDVIMDGWCKENLATLREDSHFARLDQDGNGDHLSHTYILDHKSGPEALERVEMFKARIEGSQALQHIFLNKFEDMLASGAKLDEKRLWDAQSAFHADFRQEAGAALHKDPNKPAPGMFGFSPGVDPESNHAMYAAIAEMQAVDVARSLGSNIRGAVAEAPEIIASAREMFPGPAIESQTVLSRLSAFICC
jgi:hypothetical protein